MVVLTHPSSDTTAMAKNKPKKYPSCRGVLYSMLRSFLVPSSVGSLKNEKQQLADAGTTEEPTPTSPVPAASKVAVPPEPTEHRFQSATPSSQQGSCAPPAAPEDDVCKDMSEEELPSAEGSAESSQSSGALSAALTAVTVAQQRDAVRRLLFSFEQDQRASAAAEVGRIASVGGHETKKSLAALGVIPCLVDMLQGSGTAAAAAARALVQMADGTYSNKVLMVEAGVIRKLTKALAIPSARQEPHTAGSDDLMALLQSITSLAKTSQAYLFPSSTCSSLLPPILLAITSCCDATSSASKNAALMALLNLSYHLPNARPIVSAGVVPSLLRLCATEEEDDGCDLRHRNQDVALAVLGNLALTPEGRTEMGREEKLVPACFVRMLKSGDGQCQDRAIRVLAALARGSGIQRRRMAEMGIIKVLVEVSLLGESGSARRKAAEMIDWFKGPDCCAWSPANLRERYRSRSCSSVMSTNSSSGAAAEEGDNGAGGGGDGAAPSTSEKQRNSMTDTTTFTSGSHHRDEVHRMVRQSLDRNMASILRRANGSAGIANETGATATTARSTSCLAQLHLSSMSLEEDVKDSVGSASSKSLPF